MSSFYYSAVCFCHSTFPFASIIFVTSPSGIVIVFTWLKSIGIVYSPKTTDLVTVEPSDSVNVQVSLVWLDIAVETAVETSEVVA